eukprot:SAG31_NODE_4159_length_3524_cov_2.556788_3_plen_347_part_00
MADAAAKAAYPHGGSVQVQLWSAGMEQWISVLELDDLPPAGRCKVQLLSAAASRAKLREFSHKPTESACSQPRRKIHLLVLHLIVCGAGRFAAESLEAVHECGAWMDSLVRTSSTHMASSTNPQDLTGQVEDSTSPILEAKADGTAVVTASVPAGTEDVRLGWRVVTALAVEQAACAVVELQATCALRNAVTKAQAAEVDAARHRRDLAKLVWTEQASSGLVQLQAAARSGWHASREVFVRQRHSAALTATMVLGLLSGAANVVVDSLEAAASPNFHGARSTSEEVRGRPFGCPSLCFLNSRMSSTTQFGLKFAILLLAVDVDQERSCYPQSVSIGTKAAAVSTLS